MSNTLKADNMALMRLVRAEMARHAVDCSEVQVTVTYGVIHLFGKVRVRRGHEGNFIADVQTMLKALRQRPGVRDVVTQWIGPTMESK